MGLIRFLVWTSLCVGTGVVVGTYEIGGRTTWQRLNGVWKQQSPRLEHVKDGVEDLVDGVKKRVSTPAQPKERHLKEDREAIEEIISKRSKG